MNPTFRRMAFRICVTLLLYHTAACVDTSAVRRFADASAKAGDQFDQVADDLPASCIRQHRYLALADSQIAWVDIHGQAETDCQEYTALAHRLTGANKVLVNYLKALSRLAEDKLVEYDGRIGDFADALGDTDVFDADKIEAVQGLTSVLARAAAGEWRRKELKRAIEEANSDVQSLVDALRGVIGEDYPLLLDVERESAKHYYLGQIKEHGPNEPLTVTLVFDKWREVDAIADDKRSAADVTSRMLQKIARGHQKLYDKRDELTSKQIRTMLVEYTVVLEDLINDFERLRDAF